MRVAFGTAVYEQNPVFTAEYIDTLNNQDNSDFDVLLLNDNLPDESCHQIKHILQRNVFLLKAKEGSKPSALRTELLKTAFDNGYELLILGDFDDVFSENRVSEIIKGFDRGYGFFYNDLYYLSDRKKYFQTIPYETLEISQILEYNYLGLTNTAINLKVLTTDIINELYACCLITFDWFLFLTLLIHDIKGKKINNAKTYYRLHPLNIVGKRTNTAEEIKREIQVKLDLYNALKHKNPIFIEKIAYYIELKRQIDLSGIMNFTNYNDYWWGKSNSNMERES